MSYVNNLYILETKEIMAVPDSEVPPPTEVLFSCCCILGS